MGSLPFGRSPMSLMGVEKMTANRRLYSFWPIVAICPALIVFTIFVLFPAVANIFFSFTDYTGILKIPVHWVGIANYKKIIMNDFSEIWSSIKVTFILAVSVTVIQNAGAVMLAILVNKKLFFRNFYRCVIFLPIILGPVVQGLIWTIVFDPFSGPVSLVLSKLGIESAYFGDPKIALYLVILVIIWSNIGFTMALYLAGLQGIPYELYESGYLDGAKGWSAFRYITLPLIRPSITINLIICIIGTLSLYDIIFVLTGGGPGTATRTLAMFIFLNLTKTMAYNVSQGYVAALSILQFFIIMVFVLIAQYFLRRKEVEL